jgi:cell division protease FtsH
MSDEHQEPNRPPERKTPPIGGNIVWYLLALAIGAIFLVSLMDTAAKVTLKYGDLEALIDQGATAKNPKAAIEVSEGSAEKPMLVRYSDLGKDLKFSPQDISGTVTRQILAPEAEKTPAQPKVSFQTPRLGVENDNNALADLARKKGFIVSGQEAQSGWKSFVPMVVFMLLIMGAFFIMMRRLGGTGSAMAFGRSRGKLYAQEDLGVSFSDVAGIDEAVDELREVVDFLRSPEKYQLLGGRIPKGVLLVGPPGTGKTLLAKAIAGEAGVPFFCLSGSDFVEMFVGVGAARVRDMFQQAQAKAPCIVFIDELDALGKTRGSSMIGGHDEREQTLNALLVEMDGFSSNSGVIVMAATNRPETLDPALLRPGRFDRHVSVDRPDVRGREQILKVHATKVKLDESVDLKEIARITPGFVGADLANLVNEAALLAARAGKTTVTTLEFNEGVERVIAGLEKRQRVMHPDEKQRTAYHESGHALVAYSLPGADPVHKVSIIPRGPSALGYTMYRPEGDRYTTTQSELECRIQSLLAGTVAEEMIYHDVATGAQNDLERATEIARSMVMEFGMSRLGRVNYREHGRSVFLPGVEDVRDRSHSEQTAREIDQEIKRIIEESLAKARSILETRRKALEALAERLIEKETIDNEELREIVEANSPSVKIVPGTADAARRTLDEPTAASEARRAEGG